MPQYIDVDAVGIGKADRKAFTVPEYADGWNSAIEIIENSPTADVVPRSEVYKIERTLLGVMHSVDKWLEGDELKQDEVNRAIAMREKTLRIVESARNDVEEYKHNWQKIHDSYTADCAEHYNKGRSEVAREIFEEIEKLLECGFSSCHINGTEEQFDFYRADLGFQIAELKKKYTEGQK